MGTAALRWRCILSGTVHKGYRTGLQRRGVRSPAGASQTEEETVPGVHFALEAFDMFSVRQGPVESHTKVNWVVSVR